MVAVRIAEKQTGDHHADARADAAKEVILQEPLRAPGVFDGRAEHPEHQHVEQNMPGPFRLVQKQIGGELPDRAVHHLVGTSCRAENLVARR